MLKTLKWSFLAAVSLRRGFVYTFSAAPVPNHGLPPAGAEPLDNAGLLVLLTTSRQLVGWMTSCAVDY